MGARFDPREVARGRDGANVKSLSALARAGEAALAQRYSPVVYGRDLPEIPGGYENASTDVPLLAYHDAARRPDGNPCSSTR